MTEILTGYRLAGQARWKVGKGGQERARTWDYSTKPPRLTGPVLNEALARVRPVVTGSPVSCGGGGRAREAGG